MTTKNTIDWHKKCYLNNKYHIDKKISLLISLEKEIKRDKKNLVFYKKQIETAEIEKRDGFDSERFLLKRKEKKRKERKEILNGSRKS